MKNFKDFSIKSKLLIILLTMTLITFALCSSIFLYNDLGLFRKGLVRNLVILAGTVGSNSRAAIYFDDPKTAKNILSSLEVDPQIQFAVLYDENNDVFATFQREEFFELSPPEQAALQEGHVFNNNTFELVQPIILNQKTIGKIYLKAHLKEYEELLVNYVYLIGGILIVTFLVSFAIAFKLQSIISRPILSLANTTKRISQEHDYSLRVQHDSEDELGVLFRGFNEMVSQIEKRESDLSTTNIQLSEEMIERSRSEEALKINQKALQKSREEIRKLYSHAQSLLEEERTRIAREVHDELGQNLTGLKIDLLNVHDDLSPDQQLVKTQLREMANLIDKTIETVQRITSELRPQILDIFGINEAIEWQAKEFEKRTGVHCKLSIKNKYIDLNKDFATTFYRIFQEALTNVVRHSEATKIKVNLYNEDDKLVLKVEDNGTGITEEQISDPQSFGLIGIRERAIHWGGEVKINGKQGKGTSVYITIPLKTS